MSRTAARVAEPIATPDPSFFGRLPPGSDCHAGAGHGLQIRWRVWRHSLGGFDSRPLPPPGLRSAPSPFSPESRQAQRRLSGRPAQPRLSRARSSLDFPGPERGFEAPRRKPLNTRPYGRSCSGFAGFAPCERPRSSSSAPSGEPKRTPGRCGTIEVRVAFGPLCLDRGGPETNGRALDK